MGEVLPDVKGCAEKAARELDWLKANPQASREEWASHIRGYVLAKFLLEEEEPEGDLLELARKSVSLLTGIPREKLERMDRPSGCTAATAVLDKKVLLLLSLSKGLGVSLAPGSAPKIKTLDQLAEVLREGRPGCEP